MLTKFYIDNRVPTFWKDREKVSGNVREIMDPLLILPTYIQLLNFHCIIHKLARLSYIYYLFYTKINYTNVIQYILNLSTRDLPRQCQTVLPMQAFSQYWETAVLNHGQNVPKKFHDETPEQKYTLTYHSFFYFLWDKLNRWIISILKRCRKMGFSEGY